MKGRCGKMGGEGGQPGRLGSIDHLEGKGVSRFEQSDGTTDPETAHKRVGDHGFKKRVPNCALCQAGALAQEEARKQKEALDGRDEKRA